jgi:ubiquinone/menaquinone biosynthesis C-methylase UbiE
MWLLFVILAFTGIILAVLIFIIGTEGRYFGKRLIRWGYDRRSVSFEVRDDWGLWEHLIKRLEISSTEELLDLGTQTGHLPRLVARRRGFKGHVVGIDWSEEMIHEARRQARLEGTESKIQFLCRDVQKPLPFQRATFTLVTIVTGLLDGLKNLQMVFQEIGRVLKPGGRVAFRFSSQPLRNTTHRKANWFVSQIEPLGFIYREILVWTASHEIIVFQLSEQDSSGI